MGRQKEFTGTAFPHFRIVFHSLLKYRPGWLYIRKEWTVRTSGSLPILLVHPIRIATLWIVIRGEDHPHPIFNSVSYLSSSLFMTIWSEINENKTMHNQQTHKLNYNISIRTIVTIFVCLVMAIQFCLWYIALTVIPENECYLIATSYCTWKRFILRMNT